MKLVNSLFQPSVTQLIRNWLVEIHVFIIVCHETFTMIYSMLKSDEYTNSYRHRKLKPRNWKSGNFQAGRKQCPVMWPRKAREARGAHLQVPQRRFGMSKTHTMNIISYDVFLNSQNVFYLWQFSKMKNKCIYFPWLNNGVRW